MHINSLKVHANLGKKTKRIERIFIGSKNFCRPEDLVDFMQINILAETASYPHGSVQKIVLSGVMVSQGKVCNFERGYRPEYLDESIERHQKIDYSELHTGINSLSYLVQRDLIGSLISTFDPLFKDKGFVSWWNSHADDSEVIKPEEVNVEDKSAVVATAHAGKIVHTLMIETLEGYCKSYLTKYQQKTSFEKSFCECES